MKLKRPFAVDLETASAQRRSVWLPAAIPFAVALLLGCPPGIAAERQVTYGQTLAEYQPVDQAGSPGSTATFTATVGAGTAPAPGLQWQFGGLNIEGANTGTLVLTNIQAANAGVYTLQVTNNIDRSASLSAVLKVTGS